MLRRFSTSIAGHALRITLRPIPTTEAPNAGRLGAVIANLLSVSVLVGWFGVIVPAVLFQAYQEHQSTSGHNTPRHDERSDTGARTNGNVAAAENQPRANQQASDWKVWVPNWLMVFVTIFAVIAALMTLSAIREQARTARRDAQASIKAANAAAKMAKSTEESMNLTKAALRITERAYIGVRDWQIVMRNSARAISLELVNTGKTPARDVVTALNIAKATLPPDADYRAGASEKPGAGIINPGIPNGIAGEIDLLSPEDWAAYDVGALKVIVYGSVTYKDEFGKRLHIRRFAMVGQRGYFHTADDGYNDEIDEG